MVAGAGRRWMALEDVELRIRERKWSSRVKTLSTNLPVWVLLGQLIASEGRT